VRWQSEIADYWRDGRIEPLVGAELPMTQAREALHRLGSRQTVGKVILIP
jgi:NADPH2:quinone reductase